MIRQLKAQFGSAFRRLPGPVRTALGQTANALCFSQPWLEPARQREYFRRILRMQWWPRERLEQAMFARIRPLLRHAWEHVPYYRQAWEAAGVHPRNIRRYEDMVKLPVIDKDVLRRHGKELIADNAGELIPHSTGGSTGEPVTFYYDESTMLMREAVFDRWRAWAGCTRFRQRYVYMGRPPFEAVPDEQINRGLFNPFRNCLTFSAFDTGSEDLDRYIDEMLKHRPAFIQGYASAVHVLACRMKERGLFLPLRAVLTSSDALAPNQRPLTREVFGCDIFEHYAGGEEVAVATECRVHQGSHVAMEETLVEILDGEGKQVWDAEGEVVGTNLFNYAQPLIRYRMGDLAVMRRDAECDCGRKSWKILRLAGRSVEIIHTPDGRRIGRPGLEMLANGLDAVREWQIEQTAPDAIVLRVSVWPGTAVPAEELMSRLGTVFGPSMRKRIEPVERVPRLASGKLRTLIPLKDNQ